MNEKIAILASSKKFEALDKQETALVLSEMTESEYRKLSAVLCALPLLDADVVPPPRLKAALMAQFDPESIVPEPPSKRWHQYAVTLWQAAAAVLGAVLITSWWCTNPRFTSPAAAHVIVQKDTVWVEKIVWKERVVIKTIALPAAPIPVTVDMVQHDSMPEKSKKIPSSGSSIPIAAQPELLQFFTRAGEK